MPINPEKPWVVKLTYVNEEPHLEVVFPNKQTPAFDLALANATIAYLQAVKPLRPRPSRGMTETFQRLSSPEVSFTHSPKWKQK